MDIFSGTIDLQTNPKHIFLPTTKWMGVTFNENVEELGDSHLLYLSHLLLSFFF